MTWTLIGSADDHDERERSVKALYREQADDLYAYVVRLLDGDGQRAEDIVQEALLRCWNTRQCVTGEPLRPWLFRVARNLVIDGHRSRQARPREVGGEWLDGMTTSEDDFERLLSSVVVADAVRTLSDSHREAIYETFFVGRTTQEAAAVLNVPQGTVKSRVYYALRTLRTTLNEASFGYSGTQRAAAGRQLSRSRRQQRVGHGCSRREAA
jgi:RNA polymerase sigma-70 factor (ECF subfamily)